MNVTVTDEAKSLLEPVVTNTIRALRELELDFPETCTEEHLNYLISRILQELYTCGGYKAVNDAIGALECAKMQFYTSQEKS